MSSNTNAHAQVRDAKKFGYEEYPYVVCCKDLPNLGNACDAKSARVLNLSSQTNAHAEAGVGIDYSYGICLTSSQQVYCGASTDCSILGTDYACVATLSSTKGLDYTNSHVAECGSITDSYDTQICCGVDCKSLGQPCAGLTPNDNCCSNQGLYCSHGVNGDLVDGESHCCPSGQYWDPNALGPGVGDCVETEKCYPKPPNPCAYDVKTEPFNYFNYPECFKPSIKPYKQSCCQTSTYGDNDYHYINAIPYNK